ncbi:uncharacterized protein LOC106664419 [Cimex lectularius]|uniref:Ionotropic glutamate receptor L-glutamate and glycine-binding domain-containing protein n=1 Tax=Cimex lectularius TaxID=79782 RepID=A0A8I6RIC9_CIMLE|nr:uncharacterized protein LOC106664419 [Cimex lectularius]
MSTILFTFIFFTFFSCGQSNDDIVINQSKRIPAAFDVLKMLTDRYPQVVKVLIEGSDIKTDAFLKNLSLVCDYKLLNDVKLFKNSSKGNCILILKDSSKMKSLFEDSMFSYEYCSFVFLHALEEKSYNEILLEIVRRQPVTSVIGISKNLDLTGVHIPLWHDFDHSFSYLPQMYFDKSNYTMLKKFIHPEKVNFHKRPFRVAIFQKRFMSISENGKWNGFNKEVLDLLQEIFNFTRVLYFIDSNLRYGHKLSNGTFVGVLGEVLGGNVDFAANPLFIKDYNTTGIDFSTPIMFEHLCVAVPSASPIPRWKVIFICFDRTTWLCILSIYTFSMFVWKVFKFRLKSNKTLKCVNIFFYVFRLIIASSIKPPVMLSGKIFVMTLVFMGFILATCFGGSLLNLLTRTVYGSQINTMTALDKSGLPIYTLSMNLQHDTFDGSKPEERNLAEKVKIYHDTTADLVEMVYKTRNSACLGRKDDLTRRIWKLEESSQTRTVHIVEECPRSYYLSYIMKKESRYFTTIDAVLGRLVASGVLKSPKFTDSPSYYYAGRSKSTTATFSPVPLGMDNLTITFLILLVGYLASIVIFITEIFYFKWLSTGMT